MPHSQILAAVLLLAAVFSKNAAAQWNVLTHREAQRLVASLPEIRTAQSEPRCQPLLDEIDEDEPKSLSFQARFTCGAKAGQLIGNYTVIRRMGTVLTWGDNPVPLGDNATRLLAKQLVAEAQSRALSAREAKCLSLIAAETLPGWAEPGQISVEEAALYSRPDRSRFEATFIAKDRPILMRGHLDVYVGTGEVREHTSEQKLSAGGLGELASKIFSLRVAPALTDEDALSLVLALRMPAFVDGLRRGYRMTTEGSSSRWDNILVGLDCNGHQTDGADVVVAVNINTGEVDNYETGQRLETPESVRFLKELWAAKQAKRAKTREEVAGACEGK